MKAITKNACLFYFAFLLLVLTGDTGLARPMPERRVPLNDEIGLLDEQTAKEVKRISQLLYRDFKSEMAILIIRSTDGANASDYALRVFNHWTLGQRGVDNGMLILFAIDDRRVEIMPGTRYKSRFNNSFCNNLLTRHVVPEMRANRAAQGVLSAAREVAAEIRRIEDSGGSATSSTSSAEARPHVDNTGSAGTRQTRTTAPGSSFMKNHRDLLRSPMAKFVVYAMLAVWIAGGIFYFTQAFNHGQLLMNQWLFIILMIMSGLLIFSVASQSFDLSDNRLDQIFSGSGGVSLLGFLWCFSHICPRCSKFMMVHKQTLRYATYYSSGLGEKTEHCDNCGYHRVSTYTIPRRTRSSGSSSSSSSGGGGRSSGGGGGASW